MGCRRPARSPTRKTHSASRKAAKKHRWGVVGIQKDWKRVVTFQEFGGGGRMDEVVERRPLVSQHRRRPYLFVAVCLVATVFIPGIAPAESPPVLEPSPVPSGCRSEQTVTVPAQVNMAQVIQDVYALEDKHQEKLFRWPNSRMEREMAELFDRSVPKSKLEQFYTMLFYISQHASHAGDEIAYDVAKAQDLLLSSKVFSDPEFPRQIVQIHMARKDRAHPRYRVVFNQPEVWLPLNKGLGFGIVREGMCQHAKALVFYGSFSFSLAMTDKHLEVSDFDNVDLWGTFGVRGIVDVDLNYVSVKSVEFQNGSLMGLVRAKVSRKEFAVNRHSFLLELVTKFHVDKSVQPIDW